MLPIRTLFSRASRTYVTIGRQVSGLSQKNGLSNPANSTQVAPISGMLLSSLVRSYSSVSSLETSSDEMSVESVLHGAREPRIRLKRSVQDIMQDYQSSKSMGEVSHVKYHELMGELAMQGRFNECVSLLNDMKSKNLEDQTAYSYAIMSGRRSLRFHEIRFLFGEPLDGHSEDGQESRSSSEHFNDMCKLMEEMKSKNFELDMLFYEDLARSLSSGSQAGLIVNVCTAMEKAGRTPSIAFYNTLLSTLPKKGFMQRATSLYERLTSRSMATYTTHLIRISQLMQNGRFDDGLALHQKVHETTTPNRVSYNILISGYLKCNRLFDALKIYQSMKKAANSEIAPDRYTISSFLSYYYNTSELEGATEILSDMKAAGFPKTEADYGLLIKLNARYDPAQALTLLREAMSKPNFTKERLMGDVSRIVVDKRVMNDWKVALQDAFLQSVGLKVDDLKMDGPLCSLILDRESTGNFRHMVKELAAVVEKFEWEANPTIIEYALRRMVIESNVSRLNDFIAYLKQHKVNTTWNTKNLLLQCSLIAGDSKNTTYYLDQIARSNSPLTSNSIRLLEEHRIPIPAGIRSLDGGYKAEPATLQKKMFEPLAARKQQTNEQ